MRVDRIGREEARAVVGGNWGRMERRVDWVEMVADGELSWLQHTLSMQAGRAVQPRGAQAREWLTISATLV